MNILHIKYAVEVAKLGSLNKAAETLIIATPNISRSIKELEADLGITIFQRSAKGVVLTPDGEEFLDYATDILNRIDRMEQSYRDGVRAICLTPHFSPYLYGNTFEKSAKSFSENTTEPPLMLFQFISL